MTQSGQGEEPSARPAREGIVLPSDGGEPLLPGMTGGPGGGRPGPQPTGQAPASAPASGQTWGQPWGPDQHQEAPAAPPSQGWQSPPTQQQWSTQEPAPWHQQHHPEGTHRHHPGGPSPYGPPGPSAPMPPAGGSQPPAGPGAYGTPGGQGAPQPSGGAPLPPANDAQPSYGAPQPTGGAEAYGSHAGGAPLPPADGGQPSHGAPQPSGGVDAYGSGSAGGGRAPLPPVSDEGATQYLPPVSDEGATQYLPPVAGGADEGATQYIPPVGPGALPPERPVESDPETTRFLGRAPRAGAGPMPPATHPQGPNTPAANPDAEATQYIAPVTDPSAGAPHGVRPGGGRQPLAEFDSLFRSEGGGSQAGATQQLPRIEQPQPHPPYGAGPAYAPPGPVGGGDRARSGRSGSRVPVIAAVGIGIAVLGIGAGALLGSGGGDDDKAGNQTVSAASPAPDDSASPSADPARQQAVELDKLLADSGDSRSAVIKAVADVKSCDNLAQAAKDLRDAAKQRNQLVTRLSGLTVDQLPNHAALTTALTKAWQASAAADNHYAAWADQTAGKKGCKKGQARITGQTQAGNRASGTASTEKAKAAQLWNAIAKQYGLTQRQPTQL